jgi:hypothetical protein
MFEDLSFLKDAVSSMRYQGIPVAREAELNAKGKLYEVVAYFRAAVDYLDVVKAEIVCAIDDDDQMKKCKNINECIGYLS